MPQEPWLLLFFSYLFDPKNKNMIFYFHEGLGIGHREIGRVVWEGGNVTDPTIERHRVSSVGTKTGVRY